MNRSHFSQTSTKPHNNCGAFDHWKLEKLFGAKFSRLNIEDEYHYNLSYLLSYKESQSEKLYARDDFKLLKTNNNECHVHDFRVGELFQKPRNNSKTDWRHRNSIQSAVSEEAECLAPVSINCLSPASWECMNVHSNKPKMNAKNDLRECDQQIISRTMSIPSNKQLFQTYPRLHIHIAEAPPNGFYNPLAPDCSSGVINQKSVACDPIRHGTSKSVVQTNFEAVNSKRCSKTNEGLVSKASNSVAIDRLSKPRMTSSKIEAYVTLFDSIDQNVNAETEFQKHSNFSDIDEGSFSSVQCVDYCFTCCKRTYPVDRVTIGDRVYHKYCFRCATCRRTVLPGNFSALDGVILCKPHYIEQFRKSGRYELRRPLNLKSDDSGQSDGFTLTIEE